MKSFPRIHKPITQFTEGLVYIRYSCDCVFLDKEDKKRKIRSVFEVKEGKRTNRIFCPNHKNDSYIKHRFKICPECKNTIIAANNTVEGLCSLCSAKIKQRENYKKKNPPKSKSCLQYGEPYILRKNEKIVSEPMCRNRSYCLSFIKEASTLLQCDKCTHKKTDIFED